MRPSWLVLALLLASSAARADRPCAATVKTARRAADKLVKAGDAKGALARLDAVKTRCYAKLDATAQLWLLSDMAFAAHAAGDQARCAALILEADDDAAAAHPRAARALLYNAGLCAPKPPDGCDYKVDRDKPTCKMELALEYSKRNDLTGFTAASCDLRGHKGAVKLGPGTCIEASEWVQHGDDDAVCPTLYLVDAKGKHPLDGGAAGWLASPSDCCSLREIKVKCERDKVFVLVGSSMPSRDCFGGTATSDYLTLFQLTGTHLTALRDLTISLH